MIKELIIGGLLVLSSVHAAETPIAKHLKEFAKFSYLSEK